VTRWLLLLLLLLSCACAASSQPTHRFTIPLTDSELLFDVAQSQRDGVNFRSVSVRCTGRCDDFVAYAGETLDHLLSVQFESDNRELMLVTWVTGSAYRAQVFSVSGRGLKQELEIGSRAPPLMVNLAGEVLVLSFDVPQAGCLRAMKWNGKGFAEAEFAAFGPYRACPQVEE
jgi:hypothetical protein